MCDGYNSDDQLHFNWGWSGFGNGYFTLNALVVLGNNFSYNNYAIFNIHPYEGTETYTITTESNPLEGGTMTGGGAYQYGATATLTAVPNENYLFVNWTKDGLQVSSNPICHVTVKEDATYVANFRRTNIFEVVVGEEGVTTSEHLPLTASSPYSLTQQIYLANEIDVNGPITDVSFYYSGSFEASLSINLYLKHSQKTSFSSGTNWETISPSDLCYSGIYTIDGTAGWKQIHLDTPFNYNGTDNLLVSIDNNTGSAMSGQAWSTFQCDNDRALAVDGSEYNFNPYSPTSGELYNSCNRIALVFQVTQGTDLVVTPEPIDLGYRPSGCWMRPLSVELFNSGMTTTINSITSSNSFFNLDLSDLSFPHVLEYHDRAGLQINTGSGSGLINSTLNISYGNGQSKQVQLTAAAYTPTIADVWETAPVISEFPFTAELSNAFHPLYDNYRLPSADIPDGPDAVYKLVITEESYLSASITEGENGKVALYNESFMGLGGPDLENNYDSNNPINEWLCYTTQGGMGYVGASGNFYWGIMLPVSKLQPYINTWLTKVALYENANNNLRPITINIYLGGTSSPGTLVLTQDFMPGEASGFHEVPLDSDILIDGTQNLWITFHQVGDMYPASFAPNTGDPNGRWISVNGTTWMDMASTNLGCFSLSVKGFVTNALGENSELLNNQRSLDQMLLQPGTYYLVASSTSDTWSLEIDAAPVNCPEAAFSPSPAHNATNVNYTSTQLSWTFGEGTTEYKLMFGKTPNCERTLVPWTNVLENTYTFTNDLDWNTTYYWKVCARNSECPNGMDGPVWSFATKQAVPTPSVISTEVYPSGGTVNGAGSYTDGSTCTLSAIPNSGYVFKRWVEDGEIVSTSNMYSFAVHGNRNLVAVFASTSNITFADSNVKAICVNNWDSNGDGQLSYSEAASVLDIDGKFFGNQNITSFNELEYFTGITMIRANAFWGCKNLTTIVIPRFVSYFGKSDFYNELEGETAFYLTYSLQSITVVPENPVFDSRDNCNAIIKTSTNQLVVGCKNTVIPNSVTSIGYEAFGGCQNLNSIVLPNTLTSIGTYAFANCTNLMSITLPNSLTYIGKNAFSHCSSLTSITIPSSVVEIGVNPFRSCSNLQQIYVDSDNPCFDSRNNCNAIIETQSNKLISACINTIIPNTVKGLADEAFYGCQCSVLAIPNSVLSIGSATFGYCTNLTTIVVPRSISYIGNYAFQRCDQLASLSVLAETPPVMGEMPFRWTDMSNTVIKVPCNTLPLYQSAPVWREQPLYSERYPYELTAASAQPNYGIAEIIKNADCSDDVVMVRATPFPNFIFVNWTKNDSVMSTESEYMFNLDSDLDLVAHFEISGNLDLPIAFADNNVKSICVNNWDSDADGELSFNEAMLVSDLGNAFTFNGTITSFNELQYFTGLSAIAANAFASCENLQSIILPMNITSIGNYSFGNCHSLEAISIPNSLVSIGERAFFNCSSLSSSLFIPASVNSIGERAFAGCSEIDSIIVEEGNVIYDSRENCNAIIKTNSNALQIGCNGTIIPNSVTTIKKFAFYGCSRLSTVSFPSSVVTIETYAFDDCPALVSINIPVTLVSIATNAFYKCSGIQDITVENGNPIYDSRNDCNAIIQTNNNTLILGCVNTTIPETVTIIGSNAFDYCTQLGSICIPNSVITIKNNAFANCTSLDSVVIPNTVTTIESSAFEYCTGLTSIVLSNSLNDLPMRLFYYCTHLKEVVVPNSVITIGNLTFRQCYALEYVVLPETIGSLGNDAFGSCTNLSSIAILAETPPSMGTNVFRNVNTDIPVHVPCGRSSVYRSSAVWNAFSNYQESHYLLRVSTSNPVLGSAIIIQEPNCETNTASVKAIPSIGCRFVNWTTNGEVFSSEIECSFIIDSHIDLTAVFDTIGNWDLPIEFVDPDVKAICVANWDTNSDGELSRNEAVAVTNLGDVFRNQNYVNYFDELKFFTGLTEIGVNAFLYCHFLYSVTIPSSVTFLNQNAFNYCQRLNTMTVMAETPPGTWNTALINIPADLAIYVPCGTSELYRNANSWNQFANYHEMLQYGLSIAPSCADGGSVEVIQEPGCETNAIIQATANEGYDFISWKDNGAVVSTEPVYSFVLLGNSCYVADFVVQEGATFEISITAHPNTGGIVNGTGIYGFGETCIITAVPNEGYTFVRWRIGSTTVSTDSIYSFQVTGNRNFVADFARMEGIAGASNGAFSVSGSTQVHFAKGNLQYQASTNTWRFAENQWDYVGNDNNNASESNDGWIDLFCWGTSGFNHGANCYQPWSTSLNNYDYYAYGSSNNNLYDQTGRADWGYNVINNGGNNEGWWRTLNKDEWSYVFDTRNTASGIRWVPGNVNGINGTILLPDDWDVTLYPLKDINGGSYSSNIITAEDWDLIFEPFGAVFLPPSGRRLGSSGSYGGDGDYWSSSFKNNSQAYFTYVGGGTVYAQGQSRDRKYALAVRLAKTITTYTINAATNPVGVGTIIGCGTYEGGAACTLTATGNVGYAFTHWTKDGEMVSTNATYSFIVSENASFVANFESASYTITTTVNPEVGGTITGAGTFGHGATATLTATANEGYTFVNWTKDGETLSTNATYSFTVTEAGNYVANFESNSYAVTATVNPQVGGSVIGSGSYEHGSMVTLTAIPNEGYRFVNWVKDGETVSTSATYSFTVTENGNYVANFELNSYAVTATVNPEVGGVVTGSGTYLHGTNATLAASPNDGYIFLNWTKGGEIVSQNATYCFTVTEAGDYVANFELVTCEITAIANPEAGGIITGSGTYGYGTTAALTATANEGYHFANWTKDGVTASTNATYSFTVTEAGNYVANFEPNSFMVTVTVNPEVGGSVTGSGTYEHGSTASLIAIPNEGYHFVNWTKDGEAVSTSATYSFVVTEAGNYVANFELNSYAVTATANPEAGGVITGSGSYLHGTTATLAVTPNEGYIFLNWTKDGEIVSSNTTFSFMVTEEGDYVANFELVTYSIAATANPASFGNVTGTGVYGHGTTATLTATANEGYHFVNWTKDGVTVSTNPTYSFTVTGEASFVANFELNTYAVDVATYPLAGGTVTGAGAYEHGATAVLTAVANDGYSFMNWTENGALLSTSATYQFTVTDNRSLVANFVANDGYHWSVDAYQYADNMSVAGIIQIEGVEQYTSALELGAFNGDECRGRERLAYSPLVNRYILFMTIYGEQGDEIAFRLYDHQTNEEVDLPCTTVLSFVTNEVLGTLFEPQVFNFTNPTVDHVKSLGVGWNWYSTYIELNDIDGLAMLEEQLGDNAESINSQTRFTMYYGGYGWYGSLTSINNEQMYRLKMINPTTITMTGLQADPLAHPVTITKGWNHIGFVSSEPMAVDAAFAGLVSLPNDIVKNQFCYAQYYEGYGWYGSLTMNGIVNPGEGLMYKSVADQSKTFTYPSNPTRSSLTPVATDAKHWTNDAHAHPSNMTMLAVVEIDGKELNTDDYELAAFAEDGCRGSIRLMYVEPIDRHVAFLTVAGDEAKELHFALYNTTTGESFLDAEERMTFESDAALGTFEDPFVLHFRQTTGVDEATVNALVYPNPTDGGVTVEACGMRHITVTNAIGQVVMDADINGDVFHFDMGDCRSGIYMLRVNTTNGMVVKKVSVTKK